MKKTLLALALACASASSSAALISTDRLTGGDGQLTRDTATNLDWLDLSLTFNQTVAGVLPQLASGQTFDGFRLALASEVHTLMVNGGLAVSTTTGNLPGTAAQLASASALTALLGDTLGTHYGSSVYGSRGHLTDAGQDRVVGFYHTGSSSSLFNDYFSGNPGWPGAGVWLVRNAAVNAVPEPTPLALMALALAGLAVARRRKA